MNYKLVIFDLDNTLLNFDKMELASLNQTLHQYKLDVNDDVIDTYKSINKELWEQLELGEYTKQEILTLRFERLFDIFKYPACPISFNKDYLNAMSSNIHLEEHAISVLEYIKDKVNLVIITNGVKSAQIEKMRESGLDEYFKLVVISDEVGYHKPDVRIFEYLEERIGYIDKAKTIIIGDSLSSDMKGGINYGIDTCWYNPKLDNNILSLNINYDIKSLEELYEIL